MKIAFRIKLFLFCILVILSTAIPITIITYNYTYNSFKKDLQLSSKEQILQIDNYISNTFEEIKDDTKFLANSNNIKKADKSISTLFDMSTNGSNKKFSKQIPGIEGTIYNDLEAYGISHPETTYVYIGTEWGGYVQWPDGLTPSSFDPRTRPWYSPAKENENKVVISEPYVSTIDNSNNIIISASTIIKNFNQEIVGVAGIDISLDKLSDMVKRSKVGDHGYIFIYTPKGVMLAHPNTNLNFKNIDELKNANHSSEFYFKDADKLLYIDDGVFETVIDGQDVFVNVYTSPNTGWKLASVVPKSELINKAKEYQILISFATIFILALGTVFTFFSTKILTNPIRKLGYIMEAAGGGDFSVRADIKTHDEFGELGKSFNLMIKQLSSNFEELSAVYEELLATEEELRAQYDELQYNEEQLKNSEERYILALECANDSIWEWNLKTGEFFTSDKLINITGYKLNASDKVKNIIKNIIHPDDFARIKEEFKNHIENITPIFNGEYRLKTTDGSYVWILCKGKAIRDADGKTVKLTGSISDISQRKISEEKIKFMAYYDGLTKLPNKTLFMKKLNEQLEKMKSKKLEGAVLFIDLDDFKNINDIMGHKFGDELIVNLAKKIERLIGIEDTICRFGGDEFIILNPSIKESEMDKYLNRILSLFNESHKIEDKSIFITASIGAALYPKDGTDPGTLLKNADAAMYKAKELGKNRFALYNPEIYLKLERKTSIERVLKKAIENNEFTVNYQPQYDVKNNEVFGFEALLRLNSRELGFISPAEFIPIAEACGYITQIGLWVLKQACEQSVNWLEKGYKFKSMSVNISSVDLQQKDFVENVSKIIKESGINPNIIELEITETVLMQSLESSVNVLKQLMVMGIRIALDDFGTGYSSLNYLRMIPISTLKIDKSFIDNIVSCSKEESLIKDIIQMAHTMQLKIVAEGVETKEQLLVLKDKKCDFIQGYYFSKPLPAEEVNKLFE